MTETTDTTADSGPGPRAWLIVGIVVIIAALIAALVLFNRDDGDGATAVTTDVATTQPATTESTDPTVPPTTASIGPETSIGPATSVAETQPLDTSTPTTEPINSTLDAIWPWAESDTRFADPIEAATSFAVDYIGFIDPVVGEFQAGDSRSGEVEIQFGAVGPKTVVFVRQLTEDDSWWVLGAAAENIAIDEPTQLQMTTSPLTISGSASAFEGTVDVELRADGNGEPIATGFVTASGSPEMGPFTDTIEFVSPGPSGGALVMFSRSPEDGRVIEASALRIQFA